MHLTVVDTPVFSLKAKSVNYVIVNYVNINLLHVVKYFTRSQIFMHLILTPLNTRGLVERKLTRENHFDLESGGSNHSMCEYAYF